MGADVIACFRHIQSVHIVVVLVV